MKKFGKLLRTRIISSLIAVLMLIISGCSNETTDKTVSEITVANEISSLETVESEKTDKIFTDVVEKEEKKRVIALSKSNAELWVLAGGTLIATSEDALEIEGLNEDAENLGDMDHVSLEAIASLEPDLLIAFETDPAQKALGEAAESIGLDVLYTNIDNFEDYASVMKQLTDYTNREDLYKENVEDVREKIDNVLTKVPETDEEKTYLILHVSATKSKAEKNDYFASEIFNNLGLRNIAEDNSSLNELSIEAVVSENPDYIFVIPRGNEKKALEALDEMFTGLPAWDSLDAVKNGNYYILSKELFGLKPNADWGEAYEEAYKLIYE